jgi:hypothetical protein
MRAWSFDHESSNRPAAGQPEDLDDMGLVVLDASRMPNDMAGFLVADE